MATIKTLLGNVKGKDGGGYEEVVLYDGDCSACINSNIIWILQEFFYGL